MNKVEKKVQPEYFQEILDGNKTFELRINDFAITSGDTLVLREWDPETEDYTGRELEREVGFVGRWSLAELTQFWSQEEIERHGLQVISLK